MTDTPTTLEPEEEQKEDQEGLFKRLRSSLNNGNSWLTTDIGDLISGGEIEEELLEELEMRLLTADVGVDATESLLAPLEQKIKRKEKTDAQVVINTLRAGMLDIVKTVAKPIDFDQCRQQNKPFVILMVGINGAGKTTTIGKLATQCLRRLRTVMLAAGDTFRAAAVEQLQTWGERNQVPVISQGTGADPAAVVFDALQAAQARNIHILIADTAGRLHTQNNLMEELKKIKRVMGKLDADAPHETLLVLDASQGQNALQQAREFNKAIGVDGIVLTKLDGSAKGGILLAIAKELAIPVRFIGIGEGINDLIPFNAEAYVDALLDNTADNIQTTQASA